MVVHLCLRLSFTNQQQLARERGKGRNRINLSVENTVSLVLQL